MNHKVNNASKCYIGYFENNPVVFYAVLHFPHRSVNNFKRGHRLVVLPDYQGLNIGHTFANRIAQRYKDDGYIFINTSSNKALFWQRQRDPKWVITSKSRKINHQGDLSQSDRVGAGFGTQNKYTYSYEYVGNRKK